MRYQLRHDNKGDSQTVRLKLTTSELSFHALIELHHVCFFVRRFESGSR